MNYAMLMSFLKKYFEYALMTNSYLCCNKNNYVFIFDLKPKRDIENGEWYAEKSHNKIKINRSILFSNLQDISWDDEPFDISNY